MSLLLLESVIKEIIKGADPSGFYRLLRTNSQIRQYVPDILDKLSEADRKAFKTALTSVSFAYRSNPLIKELL